MQRLVDLAELRERAERVLTRGEGTASFVVPSERRYITGVRQFLEEELEEAWLRTVAALSDEGFPVEALVRSPQSSSARADDAAAAQAQADASGRRVRYGSSTAFPVRIARPSPRSDSPPAVDTGDQHDHQGITPPS